MFLLLELLSENSATRLSINPSVEQQTLPECLLAVVSGIPFYLLIKQIHHRLPWFSLESQLLTTEDLTTEPKPHHKFP